MSFPCFVADDLGPVVRQTQEGTGAFAIRAAFVAGCHDRKEDEALLPALTPHGMTDDEGIREHVEGGRLLGKLRLPATANDVDFFGVLGEYAALLRRHLERENTTVLPFAERVLTSADDVRVERAFERIEHTALGPDGAALMLALATKVVQAGGGPSAPPGPRSAKRVARDVMRPNPGRVAPDDSLAKARGIMTSVGMRELPVVDGDRLVGILARSDMEPYQGHFEWTPVRAAMTTSPVTIAPDAQLRDVAALLAEHEINGVPVTEDGRLVGMIARRDVLAAVAQQLP